MRVDDRKEQVKRQRHFASSKHFTISASGDIRFNGQERKVVIHLVSNENNDKEEGFCAFVHHQ